MTISEQFKNMFVKVCTNATRSYEFKEDENGKLQKVPMLYRRGDLTQWAEKAFHKGENYFYHEPVNSKEPYGAQRLCEPKFVYKLKNNLTEDEFLTFVHALETLTGKEESSC